MDGLKRADADIESLQRKLMTGLIAGIEHRLAREEMAYFEDLQSQLGSGPIKQVAKRSPG